MENKVFEFIEKWLPNYKERYGREIPKEKRQHRLYDDDFIRLYFQEALENFAKAQRQICADVQEENNFYSTGINTYEAILNAPMP